MYASCLGLLFFPIISLPSFCSPMHLPLLFLSIYLFLSYSYYFIPFSLFSFIIFYSSSVGGRSIEKVDCSRGLSMTEENHDHLLLQFLGLSKRYIFLSSVPSQAHTNKVTKKTVHTSRLACVRNLKFNKTETSGVENRTEFEN